MKKLIGCKYLVNLFIYACTESSKKIEISFAISSIIILITILYEWFGIEFKSQLIKVPIVIMVNNTL